MTITKDHWLVGVTREPLPGGIIMPVRRFLVMHFTSGASARSTINFWKSPEANKRSAHVIIDRDGTIFQCRPFNRTCGHAGASSWKDPHTGETYFGLNTCSIGIELANAGDDIQLAQTWSALPPFIGRHKNGGKETSWEAFPDAQIQSLMEVNKAIVERYKIDDLVGHDDIAPLRKNDPGPAFPWREVREFCGFEGLPKK